MPYRFKHGETFEEGLIRIGLEQIDRARSALKHDAPEQAIHEARKSIKRMRALLRLVRSGIGEAAFVEENHRLRDIARSMSGARDRAVLLGSIARLSEAHPELEPLRETLQREVIAPGSTTDAEDGEEPGRAIRKRAGKSLAAARAHWSRLRLAEADFAPIGKGLATTLKALRSSAEAASAAQAAANEAATHEAYAEADEAAHDWRKAAQRHWRHMRLLESAWPQYFRMRAEEAKTVSDLLGDAQDLALLADWLRDHASTELTSTKTAELIALARADQAALREDARIRTERLTAETAKAHARQAERCWQTAGAAGRADSSASISPVENDEEEPAPHVPAPAATVAVAQSTGHAPKKSAAGGRKRLAARTTKRSRKTPSAK